MALFLNTGVDYDGPYQIRCSKDRGQNSYKGYIAVFVCMATKAIHLEVVSDLTLDAFLAALRMFFSRRGKCEKMFSCNGTSFVQKILNGNTKTIPILENEQVHWHFIHPAGPHFGGIWEAGCNL